MRATIRLGRVRGIPLGIHWSLLFIAALVTVSLAEGSLPELAPEASRAAAWAASAVAAVCFFASILTHELAHALVAQRNGVRTARITLWLLGGVAELERHAPDAGAELRIAAAGPATSLVIGTVVGAVAAALGAVGAPEVIVATALWLALINVVLAVFNLVPAAPLDGGRILTAAVWMRTGDRHRAVRTATTAGRIGGWVLVGLGLLELLALGNVAGVWTAMIGGFVLTSAKAERADDSLRQDLEANRVGDVMSAAPLVVPEDLTVGDLPAWTDVRFPHRIVVLRGPDGLLRGAVPYDRVVAAARTPAPDGTFGPQLGGQAWPLAQLAMPIDAVATIGVDALLTDALDAVNTSAVPLALVVDQGGLVGLIGAPELRAAAAAEHARHH